MLQWNLMFRRSVWTIRECEDSSSVAWRKKKQCVLKARASHEKQNPGHKGCEGCSLKARASHQKQNLGHRGCEG